jgi:hypothetical protein
MASVTAIIDAQLEQVSTFLPVMFEDTDEIGAMFKKNSKEITNLSRWLYRIPFQLYRGGSFQKYSANGGPLGIGTSMKFSSMNAGFIYTNLMYRLSDEEIDLTKNSKQSVVNVLSKTLADALDEAAVYDDISIHGDGTGRLTNSSSATTSTTMTFLAVGDNLGCARIREGMSVDVWDSTGVTKRVITVAADAPLRIETIDESTNTVTLNTAVTGITNGDILALRAMDAYGPAALTSFSAGWPLTSAKTNAPGLTNDSYRHGMLYAHDATPANYYNGKQKSAVPALMPVRINGKNQPVTFAHGLLGKDRLRRKRNADVVNGLMGITSMAQRAQVFELGTNMNTKITTGQEFGKSYDGTPSNDQYADSFDFAGIPCRVSKRIANDRFDFVNISKNWGRAEVFPGIRPYADLNGDKYFPVIDQSTGQRIAMTEFGFQSAYDFVCFDPGAEFYIDALEVPAGYQTQNF